MLVSPKEAGTLIGKGLLDLVGNVQTHCCTCCTTGCPVDLAGGMTQKQISDITGCKLHLSGMNELYPGTQMQEASCQHLAEAVSLIRPR